MEIEYSRNSPDGYAYSFEAWEKEAIASALKPLIKKRDALIRAIENRPDNEGQVKFQVRIEEIRREQKGIQEIIQEFTHADTTGK